MKIRVTKDEVVIEENSKIHKGEYNVNPIEFTFTSDYDNLIKKAIFETEKDKIEVSIKNDKCNIPMQVLQGKQNSFNLRVYGYKEKDNELSLRFSPTYVNIPVYSGSYIGNTTIIPSGGGEANLQTKSINITQNGTQVVEPDTGYDGLESVEIETNVPSSETKIEPTQYNTVNANDTYLFEPSEGYDALQGVSVTVDVPSEVNNETQSQAITQNGSYTYTPSSGYDGISQIDIDVNVSGGGSGGIDLTSGVKFAKSQFYSVPNDILGCNWEDLESAERMFAENYNLTSFPEINTSSSLYGVYGMFSDNSALTSISLFNTSGVNYFDEFCRGCSALEDVPAFNTSSATSMTNMFTDCPNLTNTSLNNILAMCIQASSTLTSPKTFADIGLSKSQVQTCQTLSNWNDAVNAGWISGYEVTVDVDLSAIRNLAGTGTDYIVPQYDVLYGFVEKYGVELTLNDNTLQEQVVGEINWQDFASSDGTLSFYIDYTFVSVDDKQYREYHFSNIQYNPQV